MANIQSLDIEIKTQNQGANSAGKLSALEFNNLKAKINELIDEANKKVYLTQDEYDALVSNNQIDDETLYCIFEE